LRGSNRIGHSVGPRGHSGHGPDTGKLDVVPSDEIAQFAFRHRLSIAIDQEHFVLSRSQGLQQEHPQMRHEIPRDSVIRIVKKNIHRVLGV
jgi:hypothetical protein